jgi:Uma2 family endonuclease
MSRDIIRSAELRTQPKQRSHGLLVLFPMTSDEFCELPESETVQLELLDGEVVVMPRATLFHQYFWFELAVAVRAWVKKHGLGQVLLDTLMKLDGEWTPAPDIAFIAKRHLKRAKEKRIEGPVDLAIEILSRGTVRVDRKFKFATYAKHGIPWYWIVDLKARVLEEYELVQGTYTNLVKAPFDEPFKPRLFPGLVIDLASLEW